MPTQVKLVQMVDLALGTPEVGAVNFNVLHTLLHAMLRKLNIVEVQAEISEFDRDFLSSSKSRQISALSDLDSGKGDDSEDALSEKSSSAGPGPRKSTPYHRLEVKVEKIAEQLEQFNNDLPKYKELFEKSSDTPVADIWKYIQMQGDVETNKKGLAEVWKLVQEMMVNMKKLEDENKKLLEKINGLNMDDLNRRLKELEDKTNDLNEKFKQLPAFPTEEEWAQFVTWPGLEDALTGVKKDWENIQPPERVVIEMSSQTEPISRPTSSRPSTRMSSSPGPSVELLDILEKLGNLTASHEALTKRVEDLEEEMKNKLDKSALENFDLSSDLLQQLGKLKEDLDALALAREKSSRAGPSFITMLKASSAFSGKRSKHGSTSESEGSSSENETVINVAEKTSSEILAEIHRQELQAIAIDNLNQKMEVLEDRFKLFQDLIMDDSAYQSQVSDLTSWLESQKNRPDPLAGIYPSSESPNETPSEDKKEESEEGKKSQPQEVEKKPEAPVYVPEERSEESKERNIKFEQEIVSIFETQYQDLPQLEETMAEQGFNNEDVERTNNKLRTLAFVLNDQLHSVRDKIFTLDHELKRMAKGVEFALLRAKVAGMNDLDSDALSRAQQAILQLQAEVERLHTITKEILEDNQERAKQLQGVFQYCDKLQDTKADKEYVQMEVDVKADKRSLDNKVNHSLFDATTNDINRMIKEILDKLAGNEETWNSTIKKFADDIDGKLDRLELDPLKEWLESRLKALNDKLRKQQAQVEWTEDDAAGIRKQLIQRFHCISCDRPVDLVPTGPVPALPSRDALPPTRSPRPYTTFELDQIRQHAKRGPRNNINFERAIAEKQLARMRKSDLKAFLVHFGRDLEAFRQQREAATFASTEVSDYYATTRPCGGSHTMTYPHKRITRLSHLSHLFREEDGTVYPIYKEEVDVQGADGHIYKGRMAGKLEAKLPIVPQDRSKSPIPMSQRRTTVSPPPGHKAVHHHRPSSARLTPRRANGQSDSRPQSAHPGGSRQGTPGPDQSPQPVPAPPESPNLPDVPPVDQAPIEVPISSES